MAATYRAVMLTKVGGPEVLQCVELPIEQPGSGQLRVRVHAAGVGSTELIMLAGKYPYAPKIPFVPGYEIAGVVDAIGVGVTGFKVGQRVAALTVHGGYGELLVREAEHFLPIPDEVSDVEAAAVILNYVTAWQMIHRVAKVRPGQTRRWLPARRAVSAQPCCSYCGLPGQRPTAQRRRKSTTPCAKLGATPIDYRAGRLIASPVLSNRRVSIMSSTPLAAPTSACASERRGAVGPLLATDSWASDGEARHAGHVRQPLVGARLRGRRGAFYGITMLYRKDPKPLREDLPKIFALVADKKIDPLVTQTFPLLDARRAIELLATGAVEGKIVLTNA